MPPELEAEVRLIDEGIEDVDPSLEADLVGMTVITGTAPRAYELARALPRARHPGGARRAARHADSRRRRSRTPTRSSSATPRRRWPQLLRDFAAGPHAAPLRPGARPRPRRPARSRGATCCRAAATSPTTSSRRRAAASTTATSASCPRPGAASRSRSRSRTSSPTSASMGARKLIFVDLNLIADRDYATRAVHGAHPAAACSGTAWRPSLLARRRASCSTSPRAAAAAAC